jgi:hypothetical protein
MPGAPLTPGRPLQAIFLLCLALCPASSFAGCEIFSRSVRGLIVTYQAYREYNQAQLASLRLTEASCRNRGARISGGIASQADGLSCQALLDASRVDAEMATLGEQCEQTFAETHGLQERLRRQFGYVRADLEARLILQANSPILRLDCSSEVRATRAMVKDFIGLERQILDVEQRSRGGKTDYGKFKDKAETLRVVTSGRGADCGGLETGVAGAIAPPFRGDGATAPRKDPSRSSDISGTERAEGTREKTGAALRTGAGRTPGASPAAAKGASGISKRSPVSVPNLSPDLSAHRSAGGARSRSGSEGRAGASSGAAVWKNSSAGRLKLVELGSSESDGVANASSAEVLEAGSGSLEEPEAVGADLFSRVHRKHRSFERGLSEE